MKEYKCCPICNEPQFYTLTGFDKKPILEFKHE